MDKYPKTKPSLKSCFRLRYLPQEKKGSQVLHSTRKRGSRQENIHPTTLDIYPTFSRLDNKGISICIDNQGGGVVKKGKGKRAAYYVSWFFQQNIELSMSTTTQKPPPENHGSTGTAVQHLQAAMSDRASQTCLHPSPKEGTSTFPIVRVNNASSAKCTFWGSERPPNETTPEMEPLPEKVLLPEPSQHRSGLPSGLLQQRDRKG